MSEKLKFDCGNRNEDCNNATICPCLLFVNKQIDSYEKVLNLKFSEKLRNMSTDATMNNAEILSI